MGPHSVTTFVSRLCLPLEQCMFATTPLSVSLDTQGGAAKAVLNQYAVEMGERETQFKECHHLGLCRSLMEVVIEPSGSAWIPTMTSQMSLFSSK